MVAGGLAPVDRHHNSAFLPTESGCSLDSISTVSGLTVNVNNLVTPKNKEEKCRGHKVTLSITNVKADVNSLNMQ